MNIYPSHRRHQQTVNSAYSIVVSMYKLKFMYDYVKNIRTYNRLLVKPTKNASNQKLFFRSFA